MRLTDSCVHMSGLYELSRPLRSGAGLLSAVSLDAKAPLTSLRGLCCRTKQLFELLGTVIMQTNSMRALSSTGSN